MTTIIDATVAGENANSYITTAVATTTAAALGMASVATLSSTVFESALVRATNEIDAHHFHHEYKYSATQARVFPRSGDLLVGVPFIPEPVKLAQVIQAEWIAVGGEPDRKQFDGPKIGPLGTNSPLCPAALQHLAKYISRAGEYKDRCRTGFQPVLP